MTMKKLNFKGVTIQTWARTIVLFLALVSQVLVLFGKSDKVIDEQKATEILTTVLTAVAAIWAWWKNNSFTAKAQITDELLHSEDDITISCGENETSIEIKEE